MNTLKDIFGVLLVLFYLLSSAIFLTLYILLRDAESKYASLALIALCFVHAHQIINLLVTKIKHRKCEVIAYHQADALYSADILIRQLHQMVKGETQ